MSPPINGMPENFIQSFQYDGQSPQNQMHPQIFMPIPAPPTPSTPRQNGSPSTVTSSNSGANSPTVDRKMMDSTNHAVNEADIVSLIEVEGQFHTITQFLLGISARVSNSDKKIELVQHTPKRDKGPQMVPVPKPIRPGGNLNLSSVGSNSNIVTFERIQFKTATANNGKRRAAQQYYVVMVDLYAQVENGEQFRVATSTSASLVVRGRSPGHYADNHERYSPMSINHGFPGDRHLAFPHGPPTNGAPVMSSDFNGNPFPGPYGQYQPFPFPPVPGGPVPTPQVYTEQL
nr:1669_t:CDS:2 [Entrophospora candida]